MNDQQERSLSTAIVQQQHQNELEVSEDWEEWDGQSPFWIHCVAGSIAGVVEHTAVYPLDTVRTNIQAICSACARQNASAAASTRSSFSSPSSMSMAAKKAVNAGSVLTWSSSAAGATSTSSTTTVPGMLQTMRFLMNEPVASAAAAIDLSATTTAAATKSEAAGVLRLWRGVQTIIVGCIPAHALHFSSYELVKHSFLDTETNTISPLGSSLAGAAAALSHDLIMTPLDTVKQRMQLGHYSNSLGSALKAVIQNSQEGGWMALYRSFPITIATNIPYGMLMVTTNEACKQAFTEQSMDGKLSWQSIVLSSSCAGLVASACTTPLDRIKTTLQTQALAPSCFKISSSCPLAVKNSLLSSLPKSSFSTAGTGTSFPAPVFTSWQQAARYIYETEGLAGFARGVVPRMLSHTPAVAISWTTYETAKKFLLKNQQFNE